MHKYFLSLILITTVSCKKLPISQPDVIADISYSNHPKHSTYQAALENYKRNTAAPGSIMLIKRDGENLWIGATGSANLEYQTAMRTNHQFRTGSITKVFTAVIVLQLVHEGKLTLDSKLSNYIPSLVKYVDNSSSITIRHLLSHQSGIVDPSNESLGYQSDILNHPQQMAVMTVEEKMKKYVNGKKLKFQPAPLTRTAIPIFGCSVQLPKRLPEKNCNSF